MQGYRLNPLGFTKNGKPFFPIAGGAENDPTEEDLQRLTSDPDFRFTKEDIEKARKEEKEKVYQRLTKLQENNAEMQKTLKELADKEKQREAAEAKVRKEAEEAAKRAAEAEMSAKELLAAKEQEWKQQLEENQRETQRRFEEIQRQREQEQALLEKERQMVALEAYRQQRIAQSQDDIVPELIDLVRGNSQEEIDASVELLKAKSAAIAQSAQAAFNSARARTPGIPLTGFTPDNPMVDDTGATRNYSADDIKNMSMEEYAQFRQKVPGLMAAQRNQGIYG